MQIKLKTHYTIKVLIHLALEKQLGNEIVETKAIADSLQISYEHNRKIIQSLTKLNIIATTRGRNGGVSIIVPITQIEMYDLITTLEGVTPEDFIHDCANCNMPNDCKFKHMLKEQYKQFYMSFKGMYLSDFMPTKKRL